MKINYQKNSFYRIYLAGFFIILSLPLLTWPIYFSPPNWAKTVVFQLVFSIMLFVFLCHYLWHLKPWGNKDSSTFLPSQKNLYPISQNNLPFWILLALFATQLAAAIFSADFHYSFFGSPYRGGGFINYGFYILFAATAFLFLKNKDWQKLWDFSIMIGSAVCSLALLSYFGLFSDFLISRTDNLSSTIGGPNTLALYLVLLVFPALSYGIKETKKVKKILYLASFLLFCFIILLTISQGAYLGLGAGLLYFLIFYPTKNLQEHARKKTFYLKIACVALISLAVIGALALKSNPDTGLAQHYLFKQLTTWNVDESRLSTWRVAFNAFLDRPILGYGPENFSIGFDQHYDPSLPQIGMEPGTPASWWDKAHNFALNLMVETGIVGFLAFALLFVMIFWKLHRFAHSKKTEYHQQESKDNPVLAHGLQSALVAYFANLMFNFENFSSYILVFLIVGYAMSLVIKDAPLSPMQQGSRATTIGSRLQQFFFKKKKAIAGLALAALIGFIWFFAIKPFNANAQINRALYLADNKRCSQAVALMNQELKKHSIIDGYLRIKFADITRTCIYNDPENDIVYAKQIIPALQENTAIMPRYTRNWLMMAAFNNMLAVAETDPERKKTILDQSREYLGKAQSLSPQRHEILVETINFTIFEQDYQKARQISQECTEKYPDFNACYWYLGLSEIYLAKDDTDLQRGKQNMEKAQDMGYSQLSQYSLTQLAYLYIDQKNYRELEWVYERLADYNPYNPKYFAGLAMVYKKNGKLEDSKNATKEILKIQSDARSIARGWTESQAVITLLLENIFEVKESNPAYHLALYNLYIEMANEEKDPAKSSLYKQKAEEEYKLSK